MHRLLYLKGTEAVTDYRKVEDNDFGKKEIEFKSYVFRVLDRDYDCLLVDMYIDGPFITGQRQVLPLWWFDRKRLTEWAAVLLEHSPLIQQWVKRKYE